MPPIKIITYLLDDDREEIELLKPHLDKVCGNDLECYSEIDPFIQAIEEGVHIAIIDLHLSSNIDGIEVGRQVLEKNPLCFLILASGNQSFEMLSNAINTGFKGHVYKKDKDFYQKLATIVEKQLPAIQTRVEIYERYKGYL